MPVYIMRCRLRLKTIQAKFSLYSSVDGDTRDTCAKHIEVSACVQESLVLQ